MNFNFMEQIDAQLQKIAPKEAEDPAYIRADCPACGTENRIHKMRARHGQGDLMPQTPITVRLYRCNACHAVHAFQVYRDLSTDQYDFCGTTHDCPCGGRGWDPVEVVI
jgi:hypothetical protein